MAMTWSVILITLGALAGLLLLRRLALIPVTTARRLLREGALIIDVRTPVEFNDRHVPGALNMPLSTLPGGLQSACPNKDQVLLLHCLGGGRSALARRRLKGRGYTRVFNLGSYRRTERIVRGHR